MLLQVSLQPTLRFRCSTSDPGNGHDVGVPVASQLLSHRQATVYLPSTTTAPTTTAVPHRTSILTVPAAANACTVEFALEFSAHVAVVATSAPTADSTLT